MPYSKYKKGDNSNCVREKLKNGKYKHVGCSTEDKIDDYLIVLRLNSRESMNEENKLKGGKADKLTPKDIAKKFDVSVKDIEKQIEKGKKVESEHTDDEEKQLEIASDHISEFPDYYDRLDKMEKAASKHWKEHEVTENTKSLIKRLIRENLSEIIFDENYFKKRIPFLKEFKFYDRRNRIEAQRISYHENVRKMYGDEIFVFPQFNASSEFVYYKQNINDVTIHNFIIKNSVHPMQPNNMSDLHYKIFIMALKQLEEKNSYSHEIILNKNEEINNVELDEVFNNINKRLFKFEEFSDENNTSLF